MVLGITQASFNKKIAPELNQLAFTSRLSLLPLTSYAHWKDRFNAVANWQPYGGPGGFKDYCSIEVGDGPADSGISYTAEQSQLSLWALGSCPLILGSDLTSNVTNAYGSSSGQGPTDLAMLENRPVIAVDQDAVDASRIEDSGTVQVFAKVEAGGDGVVALFDTSTDLSSSDDTISTTAAATGLPGEPNGYLAQDLWTHRVWSISSAGIITGQVPPEGVALYRVAPI
jgi:hypothetical protein